MTVLIVAASKSDVEVMKKAAATLKRQKIAYELRVSSAHRTPEMLDKIITANNANDYRVIIAGAGLAAALPGVIAAKTVAPVIGVPLTGAFEGLDALLAIIQMPPGIPVITTGVSNAGEAATAAAKIISNAAKKVNITSINNRNQKAADKAAEALKELGIGYSCSSTMETDAVNICFIDINEKHEIIEAVAATNSLTIYCPTAEKETAADSLKLLRLTQHGLWVGLNRGENAAIASAEIISLSAGLKQRLQNYRKAMAQKTLEADEEAREKS